VLTLGDEPPPPPPPPPAEKLQVGAYYYPWYGTARRHWDSGYLRGALDAPQQPLLGEYDSQDAQTIATHFQWAQQYGIDTFIASWWGPGSFEDVAIRDHMLTSPAIGPTKVAAFYESTGLLPKTNGVINMDTAATEQKLIDDVDYMARTLFADPGYARVGDRPVVYFYVSRSWRGNVMRAITDLRNTIRSRYGYDLYLVGDEVGGRSNDVPVADRIRAFDAITGYSLYASTQSPGWPDDTGLLAQTRQRYDAYKQVADQYGVAFIPDAQPGFNDRGVRLASNHYVLPREVNATVAPGTDSLFAQTLDLGAGYLDGTRPTLNVTTFNEWHEDTQVEPVAAGPESSGPATYTLGYSYPADGFRMLELMQAFRASHGG
jgi:glycoprotein endo-alpha-1,2-mannosidase